MATTALKRRLLTGAELANELDDEVSDATALSDILIWITQARQLVELVRGGAEKHPPLAEALFSMGMKVSDAEWGDPQNKGLQYLQYELAGRLHAMRGFLNRAGSPDGGAQ